MLELPVERLPGIGAITGAALRARGIERVGDMLYLLPRRYEDERVTTPIGQLTIGVRQVTVGIVAHVRSSGPRGRARVEVSLEPRGDDPPGAHGLLRLVWFRAPPGIAARFPVGATVRAGGTVDEYRGVLTMAHAETTLLAPGDTGGAGIVPRYSEVAGVAPRVLARAAAAAVRMGAPCVAERVPAARRHDLGLEPLADALRALHGPPADLDASELERWNTGQTKHHARLSFEEFLLLEVALGRRRALDGGVSAEALVAAGAPMGRARAALPFELTAAQARVVAEVSTDLEATAPMRRLLQGDVGSGKTAVAMLAAAHAVVAGSQVALMAPTEVLAEQHVRTLAPLCRALGIRYALVVGGARASHVRKVREQLADGTLDLAIGTHALLSEGVVFRRLRLVIVDEQHRFGVGQRLRLVQKSEGTGTPVAPHLLVMTATPIPRSLALVLYGDLAASVLDEMPPGRVPALTRAYSRDRREEALHQLERGLERDGQAYVICATVEPSDEHDLRSAVDTYAELQGRFGADQVALMHGQLDSDARRDAMERFASGQAKVLVSTTVVEVGVDVRRANVVLIEDAERFGLAQLHQLRGRVGRGGQRSACLLVHRARSEEAQERIRVLCETHDGFRIAEEDLRLRGPGELFGRRQSGLPGFRFGDLRRDLVLLEQARALAREIAASDPGLTLPEHADLLRAVEALESSVVREEAG